MGLFDWLFNLIGRPRAVTPTNEKQQITTEELSELNKEQEQPFTQQKNVYEEHEREPLRPRGTMLPGDRKIYLNERREDLERELQEIAEELKELQYEEEDGGEVGDFKPEFTESESHLRDRIVQRVFDLNQLTLSHFTEIVRSPLPSDRTRYKLDAKGFGAQQQDLIKRIYNSRSKEKTTFIKSSKGLQREGAV